MVTINSIAIFQISIPDFELPNLEKGILRCAQHLHALEGELKTPPMNCVKELIIPFNVDKNTLIDSYHYGMMISTHGKPWVGVLAEHNWAQILCRPETAQTDLSNLTPNRYNPGSEEMGGTDYPDLLPKYAEMHCDDPRCTIHGEGGGSCEIEKSIEPNIPDLTFNAFQNINLQRCLEWHPHGIDSWSIQDWLIAAGGELGEAMNALKKLRRLEDGLVGNQNDPRFLDRESALKEIAIELADTITYADLAITRLGFNTEELLIEKFNRVSDRNNLPQKIKTRRK